MTGAVTSGFADGVHTIDLSTIRPMVAHPGDPDQGIPSDPTNGAWVEDVEGVEVDIAEVSGATELTPHVDIADGIVDIAMLEHAIREDLNEALREADLQG